LDNAVPISPRGKAIGDRSSRRKRPSRSRPRPLPRFLRSSPPNPPRTPIVAAPADADSSALADAFEKIQRRTCRHAEGERATQAQLAKASQDSAALERLKKERDELTATVDANTNEISTMRAAAANFEGERNALQQKIVAATQQSKDGGGTELTATKASLKTPRASWPKPQPSPPSLAPRAKRSPLSNGQLQKTHCRKPAPQQLGQTG